MAIVDGSETAQSFANRPATSPRGQLSPSNRSQGSVSPVSQANRESHNFPSGRPTQARKTVVNLYDTDCGELRQIDTNPRYKEFKVSKPTKVNDFIVYLTDGYDTEGNFSKNRRYSDFNMLRKCFIERWPGFFIPAVPPKVAIGNMEQDFVRGRMQHLDNFLKQLGQYDFLVQSFEF